MGDRGRLLLVAVAMAGAYLALAWISLLATGPTEVSLIWPATGVIYALILYFGWRWWPLPVICVLLLHLAIAPVPLSFLPWSVASNVAGPLAGIWFVGRFVPGLLQRFDVPTGAGVLAGGAVLSVVSASFGALGMWLSGQSPANALLTDALRWVMGDLFGILTVTPAVLFLLQHRLSNASLPRSEGGYASTPERRIWLGLTCTVVLGAIWLGHSQPSHALAMVGLPLATLVWGAVRLPPLTVAIANGTIWLVMALALNLGFAGPAPGTPLDAASLAAFLCVIAAIPMTLSLGTHQTRQATNRLLQRATTDPLTGLPNRSAFEHQARRAIQIVPAKALALAYIDLDRFRLINDAMSHAVGDELICAVAGVLRANLPPQDQLARIGGDEFAVLMHDTPPDEATARAQRLCEAVASYRFQAGEHVAAPTISIGLVCTFGDESNFGELLALADTSCFAAKERGGNRVQRGESGEQDIVRKSSDTMRWALRLGHALEHDYFQLHCQSIVPLHAGDEGLQHFEILLRLKEPGKPLILPSQFIAAAERYAMGVRLDRYVLDKTLRWFERHPEKVRQVGLCSINLSASSLQDERFLDDLATRLSGSALRPKQLCFELTETSALGDLGRAQRFIAAVRSLGCRFALDDFGTGFCSFGYLRSLDVDFFKIDGSFVREIDSSPLSHAIVRSIADIGRVMKKRTIAECTENEAIRQRLIDMGVDYAQGYTVDHPIEIERYFGTTQRIAITA
ncbi:EAL domain-containing protein [Xanthomonadaceae bacterium JHOS43]|nr:EAL domain-containing protein [Xanthomonadaceae bacterium JHOS43]